MAKFAAKVLLVVLFPLLSAHPYEWRVTDWSNCSNIGHQESLDWWSSPGDLKLSRWTKALDYYPLGCDWLCHAGFHDFLETVDGTIYFSTERAGVFWTTDGGSTWYRSTDLADSIIGGQMLEDPEGNLYLADWIRYSRGQVFKSTDRGWTWSSVGVFYGGTAVILGAFQGDTFTIFLSAGIDEDHGRVYKSTNGGLEWIPTRFTFPRIDNQMIQSRDGSIYFCAGRIYKTADGFQTCKKIYEGSRSAIGLLETRYGEIYAGLWGTGVIRSKDGGESWDTLTPIPQGYILHFDEDSEGNLYILSRGDPICVYKSTDKGLSWEVAGDFRESWFDYPITALMVDREDNIWVGGAPSPPYYGHQVIAKMGKEYAMEGWGWLGDNVGMKAAWGKIDWDATLNGGEIKVKVKTVVIPWDSCEYATKGQDISNLKYVNDGDSAIGVRVEFYRSREDTTPILHEIWVEYEEYVGVEEEREPREIPLTKLFPIEPNPAGGDISIEYQIGTRCRVVLSIYDTAGRLLKKLADGEREPGRYTIMWDGRDGSGKEVASGVYIVRMEALEYRETQKLLLLR